MTSPTIVTIETPSLGDRSYLAHDGQVAVVIDPQRDIDRVLALAEQEGVRITHVAETHLHNDYVTGGLALARATGAAYLGNADDEVAYERTGVRDGDVVDVGAGLQLEVVATPGHTYTHLSYVLRDRRTATVEAVFTGGSLLYGSTGRPDLLGPDHTDVLVQHQYASAHRLGELPGQARVLPTHGFGSFCSATQATADSSTIAEERRTNPVFTQPQEQYVRDLLDGLGDWPAYYVHMSQANAAGPEQPDLTAPEPVDAAELRRRLGAGEWLVDLRSRTAFAAGHVPGTLNFGLDGQFVTYLGWLLPWGTPVTLLGESAEQVAQAQLEMSRIGLERAAGQATGDPGTWTDGPLGTFARATFADLAQVRHHRSVAVLDVRRAEEWQESHIEGSANLPIHEVPRRIGEVAGPGEEIWVHCAAGYRASIAASFLAAAGHHVVAVDDAFDHAAGAGLPLATA